MTGLIRIHGQRLNFDVHSSAVTFSTEIGHVTILYDNIGYKSRQVRNKQRWFHEYHALEDTDLKNTDSQKYECCLRSLYKEALNFKHKGIHIDILGLINQQSTHKR